MAKPKTNDTADPLLAKATATDAEVAGEAVPELKLTPTTPLSPEEQAAVDAAALRAQAASEASGEVLAMLSIALKIVVPLFPRLSVIYTDATKREIADAAGAVMAKRGWTFKVGRWKEEIALVSALALPIMATVQVIKEDLNAGEKKPPEKTADAPAAAATPNSPEPLVAGA